jgi:hypothetical protein
MSLVSLAAARAAREDSAAPALPPTGLPRPRSIPTAAEAQMRVIRQLVGFVPVESITFFLAMLAAATSESQVWLRWVLFGVVCAFTPFWIEIHYLRRARTRAARRKLPLFELVAGLVAFVAWSTTVPASPWSSLGGFTTRWGLLAALVTAFGLAAVAELRAVLAPRPRRRRRA